MKDLLIILPATIKSFLSLEKTVSYFTMLMFSLLLVLSLFVNFLAVIPEPETPPPYKMTALEYRSKVVYVTALADLYAYYEYHQSPALQSKMPIFIDELDVYTIACSMITPDMELGELKRLTGLVRLINPDGCIGEVE